MAYSDSNFFDKLCDSFENCMTMEQIAKFALTSKVILSYKIDFLDSFHDQLMKGLWKRSSNGCIYPLDNRCERILYVEINEDYEVDLGKSLENLKSLNATHKVFAERCEPNSCILKEEALVTDEQKVSDEVPLPDFIRKMAQDAKVAEDKAAELEHDQHIGYHSVENEQNPNSRNMFDEMREPNSCMVQDESVAVYTQKVFDEFPEPELSFNQAQMVQSASAHKMLDEMSLPDFIWEMAQGAKVEGNKSDDIDHELHIWCNYAEDEQITNVHYMFEEMYELENQSVSGVNTIGHEITLTTTPTQVTTKPFILYVEIENGLLNWGTMVWVHLFYLSRLSLFIDFNVYGRQICLLHAELDPELIIFDPGGCWSSLVLQIMLEDRRKLKCLFTNMFRCMYNPKVSIVITNVSILLDCVLPITLEDKGVFKGKEDKVYVRSPYTLQYTTILRSVFISSRTKQRVLCFNHTLDTSSIHCRFSLWNDHPHKSWLSLIPSLSSCMCEERCGNGNNMSAFNIAVQLSMYLYPPKVVPTLDALVYFLPIAHLSSEKVAEILDLSLTFEESADGESDGVYGMCSYTEAAIIWLKRNIRSMNFTIRCSDLYLMHMTMSSYTRLEKSLTLYNIGFLCYKCRGGASIQVFYWDSGDKIIIVELLRRLNVSKDSLVVVFRDMEVETSCRRSIILCHVSNVRAMKCWVANSGKLNVTATEFMLDSIEQSRCFIPLLDLLGKAIKRARKLVFHHRASIITSKKSENKVGCDIHWIAQVSHFVFDPGGDGLKRNEFYE